MRIKQEALGGYNLTEVAEETGLTKATIRCYTHEGYVIPEIFHGTGTGNVNLYSRKNIEELQLIESLILTGRWNFSKRGFLQIKKHNKNIQKSLDNGGIMLETGCGNFDIVVHIRRRKGE